MTDLKASAEGAAEKVQASDVGASDSNESATQKPRRKVTRKKAATKKAVTKKAASKKATTKKATTKKAASKKAATQKVTKKKVTKKKAASSKTSEDKNPETQTPETQASETKISDVKVSAKKASVKKTTKKSARSQADVQVDIEAAELPVVKDAQEPSEAGEQPKAQATSDEAPKKKRRKRRRKKKAGSGDEASQGADQPQSKAIPDPSKQLPVDADGNVIDPDTLDVSDHPFTSLGLNEQVVKGAVAAGFTQPTDIQAGLIPKAIAGDDVIGQARTGTGKTAAFGLPLLHLCNSDEPMQALVLTPTRELAVQVASEINALGRFSSVRATAIIGGESMHNQAKAIEGGAQIMVGTPGRVMDMQQRKQIHFKNIKLSVLDEVDRMFDIGFRDEIRKILQAVKREHQQQDVQTVFVSATMTEDIERLARTFMKPDAEKVMTVEGALTVQLVDQKYINVEPWDKRALLLKLLTKEKPDTVVVFCKTKMTVRKVSAYLRDKGLQAREIHGDLAQNKRNRVIAQLKKGEVNILVASDLAARGLDVEHITHVINYDLPEDPDVYVHRIGRTARAGRRGFAWSFVTPEQGQLLTEVEKLTGAMIEHLDYPDFKPGPVPQDIRQEREREEAIQAKREAPKSRTVGVDVQELSDEEKAKAFPGGIVPAASKKRAGLGSRFRRRGR